MQPARDFYCSQRFLAEKRLYFKQCDRLSKSSWLGKEIDVVFSQIFALMIASAALFGAVGTNTFHWSGRVTAGQRIEVRGINGNIHAEPAVGNEVDVIAYKNGERYEGSDIQVRVVEYEGGVTICAIYPMSDGRGDLCLPGTGGRAPAQSGVSVDFTVRVPKGVHFVARTVNGLVEANLLDADTEAHTVNGNLRLCTAGTAQGETVNGSIIASVGRIDSPLKFTTVNGGITLDMPRDAAARVHADTVNGTIQTDFPPAINDLFIGKHVDVAIGRGGPDLRIATVNGTINLRRSTHRNF